MGDMLGRHLRQLRGMRLWRRNRVPVDGRRSMRRLLGVVREAGRHRGAPLVLEIMHLVLVRMLRRLLGVRRVLRSRGHLRRHVRRHGRWVLGTVHCGLGDEREAVDLLSWRRRRSNRLAHHAPHVAAGWRPGSHLRLGRMLALYCVRMRGELHAVGHRWRC